MNEKELIVQALKKFGEKLTGKTIDSKNIAAVISEIADDFNGSGGGGGTEGTFYAEVDPDIVGEDFYLLDSNKELFVPVGDQLTGDAILELLNRVAEEYNLGTLIKVTSGESDEYNFTGYYVLENSNHNINLLNYGKFVGAEENFNSSLRILSDLVTVEVSYDAVSGSGSVSLRLENIADYSFYAYSYQGE